MGFLDALYISFDSVTPWSIAYAEAPAEEPKEEQPADSGAEDGEASADETKTKDAEEGEGNKQDEQDEDNDRDEAEEKEEDDEAEEEEEDEDDEEEIVDPKETLEEECKNSKQCAPVKHHFDDCVERVQQQESEGEAKEDCVEEFFHLAHCATTCAAPKLWSKLK